MKQSLYWLAISNALLMTYLKFTMATKQYQREANARQVKDKQRARMLNGFRPLNPPAGYIHKKSKQWGKELVRDTCAPIIREWLLHFADGTLATQTDLLNFLLSKWFCTRRGNKPDLDFIADLLERERLLKYAWFIHYEPREISMVPAQHEKFFDIDVVSRILDRLQRKPYYQKCSQSEIGEKMPLRWFLYDATTSLKYGGWPSTGKNKKITYIYYSCKIPQGNGKNKTINILHDRLHAEFEKHLKQFQIDETTFVLFEYIMKETWAKKNEVFISLASDLQDRVKEIEDDIKKIMQLIRKSQSEKMIENYENEIISLEDEKTELLIKIGCSDKHEWIDIDELIANTKAILRNPSFIRGLWDVHLQKLLLGVLFNGKIYYDKDTGFQTPEIPLVYSIKKDLSEDKSVLVIPNNFGVPLRHGLFLAYS